MRILPLAAKAGVLGILLGLAAGGSVLAQGNAGQANPNAVPHENPDQEIDNPAVPAIPAIPTAATETTAPASSPSWFDNLFSQKLPVQLGFHLGGYYDDNIFFQPKKTYDYVAEISPLFVLTLGQEIKLNHQLNQETLDDLTDAGNLNYFQFTCKPILRLYDKNSKLNDFDEDVDVIYSHLFGKLTLSLEQKYEKLSQPTIQINTPGTLINRDIFTTIARANYIYSDQLSTYGTLTQTVNKYISTSYTDNTEWLADYYFLYQLFPKLSIGLGPRIGFDDVDQEPNQSFQAGLVHFYFLATGKFTLAGAGGAEIREFEDDASATKVTPIVEGTATYTPFDSMTVTLDGERHRIVANGQPGSDYTASVGTLSVRQRFFQVVFLTVAGGYENDQYSGTAFTGAKARDDDIFFMTAGLEWTSFRGLTVDAGYEYLRDASNLKAFTFTENRFKVSATVKY